MWEVLTAPLRDSTGGDLARARVSFERRGEPAAVSSRRQIRAETDGRLRELRRAARLRLQQQPGRRRQQCACATSGAALQAFRALSPRIPNSNRDAAMSSLASCT